MKRFFTVISVVAIVSLLLTFSLISCKSEEAATAEETTEETVAEETTEETTEEAAEEVTPEREYKFACYWPIVHPFADLLQKGFDQFKEDYGIEIYMQIGTDMSMDTANEFVEGLAAQGYEAIMVYPVDATGANSLYQELQDQGIIAHNYCAPVTLPTPVPFTVATDVKAAAAEATEKVIEAMGGQGNIVDILEFVEDPNTVLRREGIEETVAKYPDVNIIQTIAGLGSIEEATEGINNVMAALGDQINGMVTTGTNTTIAASQIMVEIENKDIAYVGCDDMPETIKGIENGTITGSNVQNPYAIAYVSGLIMKYLADGYTPKEDYTFIGAPGVIVTKDNLDVYLDDLWTNAFALADGVGEYFNEPAE